MKLRSHSLSTHVIGRVDWANKKTNACASHIYFSSFRPLSLHETQTFPSNFPTFPTAQPSKSHHGGSEPPVPVPVPLPTTPILPVRAPTKPAIRATTLSNPGIPGVPATTAALPIHAPGGSLLPGHGATVHPDHACGAAATASPTVHLASLRRPFRPLRPGIRVRATLPRPAAAAAQRRAAASRGVGTRPAAVPSRAAVGVPRRRPAAAAGGCRRRAGRLRRLRRRPAATAVVVVVRAGRAGRLLRGAAAAGPERRRWWREWWRVSRRAAAAAESVACAAGLSQTWEGPYGACRVGGAQ